MARQISEKKQYGIFYTPKRVTDILCKWAIRSKTDKVLEPSFGGCKFIESSDRLTRKNFYIAFGGHRT